MRSPRGGAARPGRRRVVGFRFVVCVGRDYATGAAVIPGTTDAGWGDNELIAAALPGTTGKAGWGDIVPQIELRWRRDKNGGVRLVVVLIAPITRVAAGRRVEREGGVTEAVAPLLS